jgi:hypothetical protein
MPILSMQQGVQRRTDYNITSRAWLARGGNYIPGVQTCSDTDA